LNGTLLLSPPEDAKQNCRVKIRLIIEIISGIESLLSQISFSLRTFFDDLHHSQLTLDLFHRNQRMKRELATEVEKMQYMKEKA
jgi:hypothetical protein